LILLGAALASADTFAARLRFGRFVGMVSAEENTYFLPAVEAFGVSETGRAADRDTQPTIGFKAIMRKAADTRSYAAALSVLVVAEWLYLDWASPAAAAAEQLRTRGVDYAARQSEFSSLRRFPAPGVGLCRLGTCTSMRRLLFSRCGARTLAVAAGEEVIRPHTSAIQGPLMGFDRACEKGSLQRANSSARPR
jgi:hypothetical protein